MEINSITLNRVNSQSYNFINKSKKQDSIAKNTTNNNFNFPAFGFYNLVSFNGGNSMDLASTKRQIDLYGEYPDGIRERIDETLKNGNPDNKTLIDIHKEKYSYLNDLCETIEDARDLYPEFEGVLSDSEVKYNKGSFIDKVKNGEIKGFDKDKDVALQLLQLYWGEGFSISTLEGDYAGQNITNTFKKLNIPRVNSFYGQYLKLSDKNYNERYTQEISERIKNIERKENNEPPIPKTKGPLTVAHKKAISEGLIKFHLEHPERIFEMSEQRKQYYQEHPEVKEILSQVLLRAWDYNEARPIRKQMSRFMKKEINGDDFAKLQLGDTPEDKNFKKFWDKNPWAKEKFSYCMKKSCGRQKELSEMGLIFEPLYVADVMPKSLKAELAKKIPNYSNINLDNIRLIIPDKRDEERNNCSFLNFGEFDDVVTFLYLYDTNEFRDKWAISIDMAILDTLLSADKEEHLRYKKYAENYEQATMESLAGTFSNYFRLIEMSVQNGDIDFARKVDENMNRTFDKIKNINDIDILVNFIDKKQKQHEKMSQRQQLYII